MTRNVFPLVLRGGPERPGAFEEIPMQPPMIGTWTIHVKSAKPFTIHGDLYYELTAIRTDDLSESPIVLRVAQHAISAAPTTGQKLEVTFLMGQVTSAKLAGREKW